jgi:hypothetical protein
MSGLNEAQRRIMLERFTTFVANKKSESTEKEKETKEKEKETGSTNDNIDILFRFLKEKTTNQSIKDKLNNVLNILNPGLKSYITK